MNTPAPVQPFRIVTAPHPALTSVAVPVDVINPGERADERRGVTPMPKRSMTQTVLEQMPRVARPAVCRGCGAGVWVWVAPNAKGVPTKYVVDRRPTMVIGVRFRPDGTTVESLERRTCFLLHAVTCRAGAPKKI